jgi:hypothetical protein
VADYLNRGSVAMHAFILNIFLKNFLTSKIRPAAVVTASNMATKEVKDSPQFKTLVVMKHRHEIFFILGRDFMKKRNTKKGSKPQIKF